MRRWFWSLQFRLIVGFTMVLVLALFAVSTAVSYAAQKEVDRFQEQLAESRAERLHHMVDSLVGRRMQGMALQPALEQAGELYGWRIVVRDVTGRVLADSHPGLPLPRKGWPVPRDDRPIFTAGTRAGTVAFYPMDQSIIGPEPPWSRLKKAFNRSLILAGTAAGLGGVLFVSLLSRQVLAPVTRLNAAVRQVGRGDLTHRVPASGQDEVAELGRAFNAMAQDLETAEKLRRTLMADVAHELRTPLSNIQGYLEAVRDGLLQPDTATIDTIHEQVVHLTRIVEDLRLLALADAGALHLNREPDSVGEVLRRSVEAVRPRAAARNLSVSLEAPEQLPLVDMDRTRVTQILTNLLENAVTHTPDGGRIGVRAEMDGAGRVRVTVADSGEGIPAEDLPHIFERFYRVDSSRSRATGGAGLGLTIARRLAEAHGGSLRAESTLGQGSRFILELPARGPA